MSLEHFDDRRKALSRRQKEMAKAARVVGGSVRNMAMYDQNPDKKVELAKLLALNYEQPGALGHFIGEVKVVTPSGGERGVVRRGGVKDMLLRWTQEVKNPLEGWPLSAMAAAMGISRHDSRLRKRTKAMTNACAKLGFAAEPFQGRFKILTVPEAAIKQEQQRSSIEGQIKARGRKSKPLEVSGFEPSGKQQLQLKWWELPQFNALEGGVK